MGSTSTILFPEAGRHVEPFLDLLDKAEKPLESNRAMLPPLMKDASLGGRGKELA
jgi:hypothetical protein